jgi:hypothetical protein
MASGGVSEQFGQQVAVVAVDPEMVLWIDDRQLGFESRYADMAVLENMA